MSTHATTTMKDNHGQIDGLTSEVYTCSVFHVCGVTKPTLSKEFIEGGNIGESLLFRVIDIHPVVWVIQWAVRQDLIESATLPDLIGSQEIHMTFE